MKIGTVPTHYYHDYPDVDVALSKMRTHGYECLDYQPLMWTEPELFGLDEASFERRLRADRARAEAHGLVYNQVHGPWRFPPRDATPEDRAERYDAMARSIRGAAYLGARAFVIHCLMPFGENNPEHAEEMWEINRSFYSRLGRVAREYDVEIHLENMPFLQLPLSQVSDILRFVRDMESDVPMRVCLDTGHCMIWGMQPAEAVRMIGRQHLGSLHVHDNMGVWDHHLAPGCGIVDWRDFSAALREIGFDGVVSLELGAPENAPDPVALEARQIEVAAYARRIADGFSEGHI